MRRARPCSGMHDDRVEVVVQPPLGLALTGPRLPREDVVRGQHERHARVRAAAVAVDVLHGQPLEVHYVGGRARAR